MRITLAIAAVVVFAMTATVGVSTSGPSDNSVKSTPASSAKPATTNGQFATLKAVKATRMTPVELGKVKGLHVHFLDAGGGKLHLAGDVKTENNWSNEWGGTDGVAVAPSYHGLCKAHAAGGIFIPTRGGISTECP
jgi:hypothetical protein